MKDDIRMIARALRFTRELEPGLLPFGIASELFSALYPFVNIYLASLIVDRLSRRDLRELLILAAITVAVNAGCLIISAALKREQDVRDKIFYQSAKQLTGARAMLLDYQSLDSAEMHEKMRLLDDMHEITGMRLSSVAHHLTRAFQRVVKIVAALALLSRGFIAAADASYTWLFAAGVAGLIALNVIINRKSGKLHFDVYERMLPFKKYKWYYDREYLDSTRTGREIRIFRQQRIIGRDYDGSMAEYQKLNERLGTMQGRFNGLSALCSVLAQGAIYIFVGLRAMAGAFGPGSVVLYAGYIRELYDGVDGLLVDVVGIQQVLRWLRAFWAFYDSADAQYAGTIPTEKRNDRNYEIEFHNVSFKYPGTEDWALKDLSLKLRVGERLAIVGRNGSGKTTLIKLLCRLYDPTEGSITLNGIDIRKYNPREYMDLFSVVFQDFKLFSFMLGQNIAAARTYDADAVKACAERAGLGGNIALGDYLYGNFGENGVEISGGEAQKVALARALYKDAPFIVLDEPTAALDPIAEYEIYSRFNEIIGDRTAIYISHRLSSCRFCDDIVVLDGGALAQHGSHEELVDSDGVYRRLWEAQASYYAEEAC